MWFHRWKWWRACALCEAAASDVVCGFCLRSFEFRLQRTKFRCLSCAQALQGKESGCGLCADCLKKPPPFVSTKALVDFEFPWNHLIYRMKLGRRMDIAHWLGQQLGHYYLEHLTQLKKTSPNHCLVPIPLSVSSFAERGFNQSMEIAEGIATKTPFPILSLLERARMGELQNRAQKTLSKELRVKNMRAAFVASPTVKDKTIVLVDDVYTTGATLIEASRELLRKGATAVHVMVVARTP